MTSSGRPLMRNPKHIENPPVAGGKDPRVENIETERVNTPVIEANRPGRSCGANHHRAAIALGKMLDVGQSRLLAAKLLHQIEVVRNIALGVERK